MTGAEPFPPFNTSADSTADYGTTRRRRKSSGLGQEIRAGDTGAPSLGTGLASIQDSEHSSLSTSSNGVTPRSSGQSEKEGGVAGHKKFSKRRKARSLLQRCGRFAIKHTWVLPAAILAIIGALYAVNPTESNPISRFIFLSYELAPEPGADPNAPVQYGKGLWDIAFVVFHIVVLSFTREFIMQELLRPLARWCGIRSRSKQSRFMEQMYSSLYFAILGPWGLYVMSRTPVWYFNTRGMYEGFPHKTHEACFKFYYLFEAAYWAQQAIVLLLGLEARRKDFKELVGHHIVSLVLIALSYRFHFTYMGLAVYISHDISDFFLATSKSLNYIDSAFITPYFGVFMCSWVYLRHFINLKILLSILTEFATVGPFELNWETQQYKCLLSQVITFSLLAALQALNLFWMFFIVRIAYRMLVHNIAEDDRSEGDDTEFEEPAATTKAALEAKKEAIKSLTEKAEETPLLIKSNGNGAAVPNPNGSLKTRASAKKANH